MPASSQLISQPQENLLPLRVSENEKDPPIQDLRSSPVPDQLLVLAPSLKIWRHNPATISTLTYPPEDILQALQGTSNPELFKDLFFAIGSPRAVFQLQDMCQGMRHGQRVLTISFHQTIRAVIQTLNSLGAGREHLIPCTNCARVPKKCYVNDHYDKCVSCVQARKEGDLSYSAARWRQFMAICEGTYKFT